mmetsp:Transcript_43523/g.70638  ORF Transcript_43523/g.70638 Transcript_43523/m.70638 type:complete len:234 (-) Transcript_43523:176-877(-)
MKVPPQRPCTPVSSPIDGFLLSRIGARELWKALENAENEESASLANRGRTDSVCSDSSQVSDRFDSMLAYSPHSYSPIRSPLRRTLSPKRMRACSSNPLQPPRSCSCSPAPDRMAIEKIENSFFTYSDASSLPPVYQSQPTCAVTSFFSTTPSSPFSSSPCSSVSPADTPLFLSPPSTPRSSRSNSPTTPRFSRKLVCPGAPIKKKRPSLSRLTSFKQTNLTDFRSMLEDPRI